MIAVLALVQSKNPKRRDMINVLSCQLIDSSSVARRRCLSSQSVEVEGVLLRSSTMC